MRLLLLVFLLPTLALRSADAPRLVVEELPAQTGPLLGASLATGRDGTVWLTWLERSERETALRFRLFDRASKRWGEPGTIAKGSNLHAAQADFPMLAAGTGGQAVAVWSVEIPAIGAKPHEHHEASTRAYYSRTGDGGKTWSAPEPVARESESTEFVSVAMLADGRPLAAWLDARGKKNGQGDQRLYSRILDATGQDTLVEERVCDCCHTTLTAFPDGSALLAYRGRSEEEARDIRITRFRQGEWTEPRTLNNDDWRLKACPVNGPRLASDGGRVAAAWFTGADNDPRVLASFSPDAGTRFLMPLRLDRGHPSGHVDVTLLHDGAFLVTWLESDGSAWLRRVTPDFTSDEPVALAPAGAVPIAAFPRVALLRDYTGGTDPAQMLVAFADGKALRTLLVTIPEAGLLEAEKHCDCAPTAEELRGFPIRGTILESPADAAPKTARVTHFEVPGIFAEGKREFRLAPEVATPLPVGRQFLGRVEQRDDQWWLFDVRLIAAPPARKP